MRWYVELSRIGERAAADLYCVEAKQWQAALQETRKMRAESGPLSKLSIELMDDGYRAVDPALKLRYVVRKAPADAPLTTPGAAKLEQPAVVAAAPAAQKLEQPAAPAPVAAAAPANVAAAAPAKVEPPGTTPVASAAQGLAAAAPPPGAVPRPSPSSPPPALAGAAPAVTPTGAFPRVDPLPSIGGNGKPQAIAPPSEAAPPTELGAPLTTGAVPSASPSARSAAADVTVHRPAQPAASTKGIVVPADNVPPPPEPVAPQPAQSPPKMPSVRPTQPSIETVREPDFTLVRKREEDPKPEAPITYREYAYAVKPGTPRVAAEVLLWARYREVSQRISERPKGKFIQLAVFDHVFEKRPLRPPLATLAWKDWRGEPVLQFPSESVPAPSSTPISMPPAVAAPSAPVAAPQTPGAQVEVGGFVEIGDREVRTQRPPLRSEPPWAKTPAASGPTGVPAPPRPAAVPAEAVAEPPSPEPVRAEPEPAKNPDVAQRVAEALGLQPVPGAAPPVAPAGEPARPVADAAQPVPAAPALPLGEPPEPAQRAAVSKSEPPVMRRRTSGEDLIGELFERMHELHFMADMVSGAEFVRGVVSHMLPSELLLVHVFDINNGEFVVVRAHGPNAEKLLLYRTPDSDPLMIAAIRRVRALRVENAESDERYQGGRWEKTGSTPKSALCGGVKQGGRYLGAIELVNPMGGGPFHDSEINALDYICEQFAEFLANRPIVLDADVVLPKS